MRLSSGYDRNVFIARFAGVKVCLFKTYMPARLITI
jgi:hypothetical protein